MSEKGSATGFSIIAGSWIFVLCAYLGWHVHSLKAGFLSGIYVKYVKVGMTVYQKLLLAPGTVGWVALGIVLGSFTLGKDRFLSGKTGKTVNLIIMLISLALVVIAILGSKSKIPSL